ncbi:hypothetical protein [Natrinema salaciae]|uniref:Uncharacterized protein n=1 Tax=Natrinema salaciae TaxID=1186196 RepID=A0A1H9ATH7_9EURY|nr:hypothetical protein [Natrinema salaciae]SEP79228.1 hypothetical protein SAMN04489841_0523 [Natrinema salaciae]
MTVRIDLDEHESVELTDTDVRKRPPDRLEFATDGNLTVVSALLAEFEGATLNPVRVTISAADANPVAIDLTGPASLRLENVDVGVATPDGADIADEFRSIPPSTDEDAGSTDSPPSVIAFTVDGAIRDVPPETLAAIGDDEPTLETVTFAVGESIRSDGGPGTEVIFELALFGYGIVVRRDGTITIGTGGRAAGIDPRDEGIDS